MYSFRFSLRSTVVPSLSVIFTIRGKFVEISSQQIGRNKFLPNWKIYNPNYYHCYQYIHHHQYKQHHHQNSVIENQKLTIWEVAAHWQ